MVVDMTRRGVAPVDLADYRDHWHMSPGVLSNGFLFLTGMTGHRPQGPSPDPETQIRAAFSRVDSVLREAGLDSSHIVEMTSFHVGLRHHLDVFRRVRDEYLTEPYPAWTAVGVTDLITDGTIVELRVVADARTDTAARLDTTRSAAWPHARTPGSVVQA
jgi:enamine deaminase RidA (YjgF/YER057c/UK114 family)